MKTNKTLAHVFYVLIFAAGILLGKWLFGGADRDGTATEHIRSENEAQVWTCSMHPQIRQDKQGKCPLCAMDLIPLKPSGAPDAPLDPDAIQLSDEAAALASVRTMVVGRSNPVKEMRLYGTIKPDERLRRSLVSHVSGRIETLSINFAGETVQEGQVIATIYSPDLLNAQQELLEAKKIETSQPALLHAAREKLRFWKLTDSQIDEIEQTGRALPVVKILANAGGTVIARRVQQGDYVSQGETLFDLADLSSVWAVFDAYEQDLPYLKTGDHVDYTLHTLPGKTFTGRISFIDPILDKTTRTAKIRVETANPKLELKPEMYAGAIVKTSLKQQGNETVVPKTAVLWTGRRSVVYVKQPDTDAPVFKMREVELGASLDGEYVILSGLDEGEEVVVRGTFVVDASAQLEGKPSMMSLENTSGSETAISFTVCGLCEMCKDRIEKAARSVAGVSFASWNRETTVLDLAYNPEKTSPDAIGRAIAKAGHDNATFKATDSVYETLPACCKYRN
ncbi:MAG: efflux RND transporter periplasmic adaptor subunit [Tannerella sp.]|jgi:Cu(I)/Ag(I) efflux system membrane fusion protein|nr:efflux RND transporter periplasmic adaptor subunit [Tannerella sp.]